VLHHLARPWRAAAGGSSYFFCPEPGCEIVYFEAGGQVFGRSDLRTAVGVKAPAPEATLCYCFGVTYGAAEADPAIRAFVVNETRNKTCSCEVSNPSGTCCLKNFPRGPDAA